jgi:hypothetical protein
MTDATQDRVAAHHAGVRILHARTCVNCDRPLFGWPEDDNTAIDGEHCEQCYRLPQSACKACRDE